ncbi:MAG TPA: outer membrane lipoprotein carrier protein LolA [Methylomirabilota bacterium]|nr:outer membrane lipoprotein carrier protein LolA [Methylomirabilota bacterium]
MLVPLLLSLVVASAWLGVRPVMAQSLDEVLLGVEATYQKLQDLRADFRQEAFNKSLGQTIKANGTVYLKKGGKMRWEYRTPSVQEIVSDGKSLWVYTAELKQVTVSPTPSALAGPAGSFLAGLGRVRNEFSVRFGNPSRDAEGNWILNLTPKRPEPALSRLVLSVDPKEFLVRRAVLYDEFQNIVTMTFTKVVMNPALADKLFSYTPPPGVVVVPLNQ